MKQMRDSRTGVPLVVDWWQVCRDAGGQRGAHRASFRYYPEQAHGCHLPLISFKSAHRSSSDRRNPPPSLPPPPPLPMRVRKSTAPTIAGVKDIVGESSTLVREAPTNNGGVYCVIQTPMTLRYHP